MNDDNIASHLSLIFTDHISLCGCGNPQSARTLIYQILALAPLYENQRHKEAEKLCGTDGAFHIVMGALTHAGLLEHASILTGSWLTNRGRWFLWAVDHLGGIDAIGPLLDQTGYPHDWNHAKNAMQECTDTCWVIPATT